MAAQCARGAVKYCLIEISACRQGRSFQSQAPQCFLLRLLLPLSDHVFIFDIGEEIAAKKIHRIFITCYNEVPLATESRVPANLVF